MREIKFRVWNGSKFIYSEKETGGFWGDIVLDDSELVIKQQQYTGLKDKTGKEIYEGDIVEFIDETLKLDDYYPWSIEWDEAGYWNVAGYNDCVTVIGNIYENPELLNDLKD